MPSEHIEKTIIIDAPRAQVWRAIADANEFGTWFGARFDEPFVAGARIRGNITEPGYEHVTMDITVERIEPPHLLSFRWHPYAIDTSVDYSAEPMTLVEFRLEDVPDGTRLTLTESGFDGIPAQRRDEAYRMNDRGWTEQMKRIERHCVSLAQR